jgi:uncharacterized protein YlxW (UPF0749 family)
MEKYEFVLAIVAIVMFASVLRARYGYIHRRKRGQDREQAQVESPEAARLKEEVRSLKERIAVLERIATDKESTLEREFERLRDR